MALLISLFSFNLSTTLIVITFLHFLFLPTHNFLSPYPTPDTSQVLLVQEKTRLGSTPPSCYNKCNKCHPCMAVQVPTLPSHGREKPVAATAAATSRNLAKPVDYSDSSSSSPSLEEANRYSNYKPLGWKCRCNGHFYNP